MSGLRGIGVESATLLVREGFSRSFSNRRALGSYVERIHHLAGLSLVRHIFEMLKEYRRLDKSCAIRPDVIHRPTLPTESEDVD